MRFRWGKKDDHKFDEVIDELLEQVWTGREKGEAKKDDVLSRVKDENAAQALELMDKEGLIKIKGNHIDFLEKGENLARNLIRRHRLAECLFSAVLELPDDLIHSQACCLEHERVLSAEATDSICAFLGHPPTCPHGKPIPPGECCKRFVREVKPLVIPLTEAEVGEIYRIIFIAPKCHHAFDRLGSLGIEAGSEIKLHQKSPAYVVMAGETEVAIDEELAKAIYVKKVEIWR